MDAKTATSNFDGWGDLISSTRQHNSIKKNDIEKYNAGLVAKINQYVDQFQNLPENWDGYGGGPISIEVCNMTVNILMGLLDKNVQIDYADPGGDDTFLLEFSNGTKIYIEGKDSGTVVKDGKYYEFETTKEALKYAL